MMTAWLSLTKDGMWWKGGHSQRGSLSARPPVGPSTVDGIPENRSDDDDWAVIARLPAMIAAASVVVETLSEPVESEPQGPCCPGGSLQVERTPGLREVGQERGCYSDVALYTRSSWSEKSVRCSGR